MGLRNPTKTLLKGRYNERIQLLKEVVGDYGEDSRYIIIADTLGSVHVMSGTKALHYNQLGITNPVEVMFSDPRVDFNMILWHRNDGTTKEITINSPQDIGNYRLDVKILGDMRNTKNI